MIIEQMRTVLLVSDQSWQDILSLVPIAIRPERKLPVLIYHQEGNTIDIDATLHFLRSYLLSKDRDPGDAAIVHIGAISPEVRRTLVPLLIRNCQIAGNQIWQATHIWALQSLYTDVKTWVVVARDDYESGLVTAPFAALEHAHLCFLDAETLEAYRAYKPLADSLNNLETVYLVGQLDEQVSSFFDSLNQTQVHQVTSKDIQKMYLEQVQTDKIILVNPQDIDSHYEESNENLLEQTSQAFGEICELYGKCSLVAPFLAAAKQETIIPVSSTDPKEIDEQLNQAIADLELEPRYLTIVASPEAIPMSIPEKEDEKDEWVEIDGRRYGSIHDWQDVDWAVGRIFGITVSDCSAYVARVLFFEDLEQEPHALLMLWVVNKIDEDGQMTTVDESDELKEYMKDVCWTEDVRKPFSDSGHTVCWDEICVDEENPSDTQEKEKEIESHYRKASLILYTGHAHYDGFGDSDRGVYFMSTPQFTKNRIYLDGFPVILGVGCSTGAYEWLKHKWQAANTLDENLPKLAHLFVAQNIRRGAMAQQCAVSLAYWHQELDDLLKALYEDGLSVGEAIRLAKNSERCHFKADRLDNFTDYRFDGDPQYLLVGDPTFVPKDYMR